MQKFSKFTIMASSRKSVYIETTIPSLVTAKPSRDIEYNIRRNLWTPGLLDPDTFMRKMKLEEAENG